MISFPDKTLHLYLSRSRLSRHRGQLFISELYGILYIFIIEISVIALKLWEIKKKITDSNVQCIIRLHFLKLRTNGKYMVFEYWLKLEIIRLFQIGSKRRSMELTKNYNELKSYCFCKIKKNIRTYLLSRAIQ